MLTNLPDEAWAKLAAYAAPRVELTGGPTLTGDPVIDALERQLFEEARGG